MIGSRHPFPDLSWTVYLDHAAIGPLPRTALQAIDAAHRLQAQRGVAAMPELFAATERVRAAFGTLISSPADTIALTSSTSDGVLAVARCLPWRSGDRILLFRGEFPTNITPWQRAAEDFGLELVWADSADLADASGIARIEGILADGVRLIAVSAVQFQTGLRAPWELLGPLAHHHGAELFVDAIQALGCVPLSMASGTIDYLATGGQKWLHGPVGTGALAMSRAAWDRLVPRLASWLSHEEPLRYLGGLPGRLTYDQPLQHGPAIVEGGSRNLAGLAGLATSLELRNRLDDDAVMAHVQTYLDGVEAGLIARGFTSHRHPDPSRRSGILAVTPPVPVPELARALRHRGVSVSTPDGLLRMAPSWPNDLTEVPVVLEHVDAALEALR